MNTTNANSTNWWIEYETPSIKELCIGINVVQGTSPKIDDEDENKVIYDGDGDLQ